MKKYLKKIKNIIVHLKKPLFTSIIIGGIPVIISGVLLLDIALILTGVALIAAGAIGLVMSLQTEKIAADICGRFDRQDELAALRHKELVKNLEENREENTKNHQEVMGGLKEITTLLKEILKALQKIDKKLDN